MTERILIRADDLGYSEAVNYGIEKTVRKGLVRSVGLMPNMPAAAHGVALLKGLDVCLGQHTNLCLGRPLTDPAKIPSLVDESGLFKTSRVYRSAKEDFTVLEELVLEIEAQYQRFVALTGKEPAYFEAHAVFCGNLDRALRIVARRHSLRYLPLSLDGVSPFGRMKLRFVLDSMKPDYDPLATLKRACEGTYRETELPMLILHPGYLDAYLLRNSSLTLPRAQEVEMAERDEAQAYLKKHNISIVNYDEIY